MKKLILSFLAITCISVTSLHATIHEIRVWNGYFKFLPSSLTIQLGDTIHWLPFDSPTMTHTITSTNIPTGATTFDQIWQLPADTFFQYIPQHVGTYDYVCTPHEISYGMIGSFTVQNTTSLNETKGAEQQIQLFPNPASNFLNISNKALYQKYTILNLNGKTVLQGDESRVNTSGLPNGIYFLRLRGQETKLHKFVISD